MKLFLKFVHRLEEWTLTITLLGLAVVAFVQVFCRYVLGISFPWFEEAGRYLGVFITFLGAAIGIRYGMHFAMDLVITSLPGRLGAALRCLSNLLCAACFAVVVWHSWKLTMRIRGYETTTATMQLPMWWAYMPIPVFSAVMVWRFASQALFEARTIFNPELAEAAA